MTEIKSIDVQPNPILSGGVATLKAEVDNPPSDWQASGYTIQWSVGMFRLGSDQAKIDPDDPTKTIVDMIRWGGPARLAVQAQLMKDKQLVGNVVGLSVNDETGYLQVDPRPTVVITNVRVQSNAGSLAPPVKEGALVSLEAQATTPILKSTGLAPLMTQEPVDEAELAKSNINVEWYADGSPRVDPDPNEPNKPLKAVWNTTGASVGTHKIAVKLINTLGSEVDTDEKSIEIQRRPLAEGNTLPVSLQRTSAQSTRDQALWVAIRNRTKAIAFSGSGYKDFIDAVLCGTPPSQLFGSSALDRQRREYGQIQRDPPNKATTTIVAGVGAYELLKTATEAFLLLNCGVAITERDISSGELLYTDTDEATRLGNLVSIGEITRRLTDYLGGNPGLPYINTIIKNAFPGMQPSDRVHCDGVLVRSRVEQPCLLELIWSYWHEEGMLVQSMNVISRRFQNLRSGSGQDPLAHLEIDPIRPLNNVLWGYIQDEQHRLTVQRRAYEYDHHYGMTLYGKAVPPLQSADSRSKFLEAYHNLLHLCTVFYLEDDDTTRIADAFQLLNALKETHLLLALGATNQFGDLPWTARVEMLMQQWLLARSEMRDFLQSRPMVPYQEGWMAQVDAVKKLKGWTDVSVMHFHELGVYGEQILLSVRYGDWINVNDPAQAANWARYWRPEIQGYMHAYRAVTGVDLAPAVTSPQELSLRRMPPSVLLRQRLDGGAAPMLPAPASVAAPQGFRARRAAPRN